MDIMGDKRESVIKRLIDIIVSLLGLIFLSPFFAILFIAIRINMGTPVFFRQKRPGLNAQTFEMIKFRSMKDVTDSKGNLLPDSERLTKLGKFIRETSLDELPELWNVLKGDMSLVGPRPLLIEYLPLYSAEQARRHNVRPGVTGWAQVNGRNAITWDEKFKLDVWYVENQTLIFDMKILLLTLSKVIRRDGISAEGDATMPKFGGSECQD